MLDDHPKYLDDLTIRLPTDCESNYPLMPNSSHPIRWQFPAGASKTAVTGVNLRGGSSQSGGFIPVKRICRLSNERGRERERGDNGERKECAHYNKIDAGASRARGSNKTRFCVATANKDRTTQLRYSAMRRGARRMREKERDAGKTEGKKGERRGRKECKHESFTTAEYVKREPRAIHRSHVATYTPRLARSLIMARIEELFIYLVQ